MNSDLEIILADKRELRRSLAALPIEEKLRLLDMMRGRECAIRFADRSPRTTSEQTDRSQSDSVA